MDEIALRLHAEICSRNGILSSHDASGSIGRRYARADEVGIPWCITIDHQCLEDNTATIRRRDDQRQIRCKISEIPELLSGGNLNSLFD